MTDALVIGYGNDLRSDDGAGRWVADALEALALPDVEVRSVVQLTPELAMAMAGRRVVVFVDASVEVAGVEVRRLAAPRGPRGPATMAHHMEPESLLSLAPLFGAAPGTSYLVSIPAADLGVGSQMTPATRRAAAMGRRRVLALLEHVEEGVVRDNVAES